MRQEAQKEHKKTTTWSEWATSQSGYDGTHKEKKRATTKEAFVPIHEPFHPL
jgi:hypothetical protein